MSLTSKTKVRRALRKKRLGKQQKKERARAGTPRFPIHPEGDKGDAATSGAALSATAQSAAAKSATAKSESKPTAPE